MSPTPMGASGSPDSRAFIGVVWVKTRGVLQPVELVVPQLGGKTVSLISTLFLFSFQHHDNFILTDLENQSFCFMYVLI